MYFFALSTYMHSFHVFKTNIKAISLKELSVGKELNLSQCRFPCNVISVLIMQKYSAR